MKNIIPNKELELHIENILCNCKPNVLDHNGEVILIHNCYNNMKTKETIDYNTEELKQVYRKGLLNKKDIEDMLNMAIMDEEYEIAISMRDLLSNFELVK